MRGKANTANAIPENLRITPAYAGKSDLLNYFDNTVKGSPPPMRGKATIRSREISACRITPAYAGKSFDEKNFIFSK